MSKLDELTEQLTQRILEAAPELICQVTTDPSEVKPSVGKASVWIEPPELAWEGWEPYEPDITITLCVVAGTPNTQQAGLRVALDTLDALHRADINLNTAKPVGFDLSGAGTLAAYEATLNPM